MCLSELRSLCCACLAAHIQKTLIASLTQGLAAQSCPATDSASTHQKLHMSWCFDIVLDVTQSLLMAELVTQTISSSARPRTLALAICLLPVVQGMFTAWRPVSAGVICMWKEQ